MRSLVITALTLSASTMSLLAASGCADTAVTDELAGETSADTSGDGKADSSADGAYTYFAIAKDLRACSAPACGGYQLARLNRTTTVCHDGSTKTACYTPELDWSEASLSAETQQALLAAARTGATGHRVAAIVRGRFAPRSTGVVRPELGRFIITEAWTAQSATPADGVFAKVRDAGIRCIAAPCESLREKGLNTSRSTTIAGIDYSATGLTAAAASALADDMYTAGGIIIAGDRYTITESGRTARGRTATAAYQRLVDRVTDGCVISGCSGEVCADEGHVSSCIWHEEYACYQAATCGRQDDGACSWNQTGTLAACLGH